MKKSITTKSGYEQWIAELRRELYYEKNKEKIRGYQKGYYHSHRDAQLATAKENQRARAAGEYVRRGATSMV